MIELVIEVKEAFLSRKPFQDKDFPTELHQIFKEVIEILLHLL